jgi:WD40 repeat protein
MWDLQTGQVVCNLVGHQESIRCLQVDRSVLLSGSNDHSMKVWDLRTATCASTLKGHTGGIRCLQFSGAGLVSGSADKTVKYWDLRTVDSTSAPVTTLLHHQTSVTCLQWTNSIKLIMSIFFFFCFCHPFPPGRILALWSAEPKDATE